MLESMGPLACIVHGYNYVAQKHAKIYMFAVDPNLDYSWKLSLFCMFALVYQCKHASLQFIDPKWQTPGSNCCCV